MSARGPRPSRPRSATLIPAQAAAVLGLEIPADRLADLDPGEELLAFEYAVRARAVERYPLAPGRDEGAAEPHDGGADGCPPAAVRHVCAGALVASLVSGWGFPYGEPPLLPLGAGPIRPETTERASRAARLGVALRDMHPEPRGRGRYEVAEDVMQALLGVSDARDPEGPANERIPGDLDPREWTERVIDAAIDLLCDERHHVAEIAAGIAEWAMVLAVRAGRQYRDSDLARARRICRAVGVRFPR